MSHPLLTQVLADGLYPVFEHGEGRGYFVEEAAEVLAHIPAAIADRLEAALDVCAVCGMGHHDEHFPEWHVNHEHCHPYVPLVTP